MDLLLKNAIVIDPRSSHFKKKRDILIKGDKIIEISSHISPNKAKVISIPNLHVSLGWVDIGTQVGEPGLEHRETLETVSKAARRGGYTGLVSFPNTNPVVQTKSDVQFLRNSTSNAVVQIYPAGAISKNCDGKDINELVDMHRSGAVAFTDGDKSIRDAGTLLRALQYVKSFDGVIIDQATNPDLVPGAYVHEGEISTKMGLKGIPSISEEIRVERNLRLLSYTDSKILIHNISSKESIALIKKSKFGKNHLQASVASDNLIFNDSNLKDYDPSFKTMPPLREKKDMTQLIKGVKEGTIGIINSNHQPQDLETKSLEFAHASFGNIGLESCFGAINTHLGDKIKLSTLIDCISYNPRRFLDLPTPKIEAGERAILTLFDPELQWKFEKSDIQSKSHNSPFIGHQFLGKPLGTYNNATLNLV